MAKRYNPNRVRLRHSYTTAELAAALKVHKRTVQGWHKKGLEPLSGSMPYLFMGYQVREFLKKKSAGRKNPLAPDEVYCLKCHKSVKLPLQAVSLVYGGRIGKTARQVIIKTACPICGAKANRFTTDARLRDLAFASCAVDSGSNDYLATEIASQTLTPQH